MFRLLLTGTLLLTLVVPVHAAKTGQQTQTKSQQPLKGQAGPLVQQPVTGPRTTLVVTHRPELRPLILKPVVVTTRGLGTLFSTKRFTALPVRPGRVFVRGASQPSGTRARASEPANALRRLTWELELNAMRGLQRSAPPVSAIDGSRGRD